MKQFYQKPSVRIAFLCMIMIGTGISLPLFYRGLTEGPTFVIEDISVNNVSDARAREIEAYLQIYLGRSLYGTPLQVIQQRAEQHPWIKSAAIRRMPPSKIEVDIRERQALAMIKLDRLYLVDGEGELFKISNQNESEDIPLISGIGKKDWKKNPLRTKQQMSEIIDALSHHQSAKKPGGEISELRVNEQLELRAYFRNGLEVVLGKDDYQKKWNKLVQILLLLRDKKSDLAYAYLDDYPNTNQVAVRFKKMR